MKRETSDVRGEGTMVKEVLPGFNLTHHLSLFGEPAALRIKDDRWLMTNDRRERGRSFCLTSHGECIML